MVRPEKSNDPEECLNDLEELSLGNGIFYIGANK
jgi:hypothetical protein